MKSVNVLTVIANESYTSYVERLQVETQEEYGDGGLPPAPPDARKRGISQLRKEYTLKPEFRGVVGTDQTQDALCCHRGYK